MAITDSPTARPAARPFEAGLLLVGAGAILLFVSLFLDWYQPGLDAWTVFEVWDLVLALLAAVALGAVAARLGFGPARPGSWLIGPSVAAFVIVLFAIINHPPAASGTGNDPETGLWLALVASVLMLAGTALSVARISVALNVGGPVGPRGPVGPVDPVGPADPVGPVAPHTPPPAPRTPPTEPTRPLR
jgi:hypothetical protein